MDSAIDKRARRSLSDFGSAVGDPVRAAMLVALVGGVSRPASELARLARVAPSTASSHLHRLEEAGLLVVRKQGRHRYYALSGSVVADVVEILGARTSDAPRASPFAGPDALALARTCYGHLAGRLAVAFWSRAREDGWVRWSDVVVTLTPKGLRVLAGQGLDPFRAASRAGRPCIDWSERRPHVSGPLGVALCAATLEKRWLSVRPDSRALRITARGEAALRALGVRLEGEGRT